MFQRYQESCFSRSWFVFTEILRLFFVRLKKIPRFIFLSFLKVFKNNACWKTTYRPGHDPYNESVVLAETLATEVATESPVRFSVSPPNPL